METFAVNHWEPSKAYKDYCRAMRGETVDGEIIASMGESRVGDEHTDADDALWAWSFYRQENGQWRWSRRARNGKVIAASTEAYHNLKDCEANAAMSGYVAPAGDIYHDAVWTSESDA